MKPKQNKISFHHSWNGIHKKEKKVPGEDIQKDNTYTTLEGMQISSDIMESGRKIPHKNRSRVTI